MVAVFDPSHLPLALDTKLKNKQPLTLGFFSKETLFFLYFSIVFLSVMHITTERASYLQALGSSSRKIFIMALKPH